MITLSLDALTVTDTSPPDLIRSAAAAGFPLVSLWINELTAFPRQRLLPAMERECAALFRDTGVAVYSLEALNLVSEEAIRAHRPGLELGARLGAKVASCYQGSNPDHGHAADLLAQFVETAGEFGLEVVLEPVAMAHTRTLAEAEALIARSGASVGILFDTWHLIRTGGGVAELRAIDPARIRYVQINDGLLEIAPEMMIPEATGERLYPGEGEFPLVELLRLLPRDIPWAVETPSVRRAQRGDSAQQQAQEVMAAMQRLLARVNEGAMG